MNPLIRTPLIHLFPASLFCSPVKRVNGQTYYRSKFIKNDKKKDNP